MAATSLSPYKIVTRGGKIVVVNNADQIKATFDKHPDDASNRADALKYLRALYANVPGAPKQADKTPWTGTKPVPAKARDERELAARWAPTLVIPDA